MILLERCSIDFGLIPWRLEGCF